MTKEVIIEKVNGILTNEFEIAQDKLQPNALLIDEVGIDSLDFVDIVALLEKEFGFKPDTQELKKAKTLNDLYDFIAKIISRITLIGSLFLAFIAIVPLIFSNLTGLSGLMMGGTSVIILVGVALETMRQLESQLMMRHYKGFLD